MENIWAGIRDEETYRLQLQLYLAISIVNIFILILDIPKEAHNMYFKGLIAPRRGEYSHAFPVACTQS